jgi:hypothetical protein
MLFGRYWLHAATERALTERASSEAPALTKAILTMAVRPTYHGHAYYGTRCVRVAALLWPYVLALAMPAMIVR